LAKTLPEILIADDSQPNRLALAALTSDLQADIMIAASGPEAITVATENKPDLISYWIADTPDMDGYQVINRLSGNDQTINIQVILKETNFSPHKADYAEPRSNPS
jgi:adenylate cyclase